MKQVGSGSGGGGSSSGGVLVNCCGRMETVVVAVVNIVEIYSPPLPHLITPPPPFPPPPPPPQGRSSTEAFIRQVEDMGLTITTDALLLLRHSNDAEVSFAKFVRALTLADFFGQSGEW